MVEHLQFGEHELESFRYLADQQSLSAKEKKQTTHALINHDEWITRENCSDFSFDFFLYSLS